MKLYLYITTVTYSIIALVTQIYLIQLFKIDSTIIIDTDIKLVTDKDIVVPFDVNAAKMCFQYGIKNCLTNHPKIYDILDDKARCYQFTENLGIKNIPTFITSLNNSISNKSISTNLNSKKLELFINQYRDLNDTFIAKEINSAGSVQIYTYKSDELLELWQQKPSNFTNYIIQPYLNIKSVITVDCLSLNGKIQDVVVEEKNVFFKKENIVKLNNDSSRKILTSSDSRYNKMIHACQVIANKTQFNGFFELEFIEDERNTGLLLMEINPRICFVLFTFTNDRSPYVDKLVIKYLELSSNNLPNKSKLKKEIKYKINIYNNSSNSNNYIINGPMNFQVYMYHSYMVIFVILVLLFIVGLIYTIKNPSN